MVTAVVRHACYRHKERVLPKTSVRNKHPGTTFLRHISEIDPSPFN